MVLLLVFGVTLLAGVLISALADRSIVSTAVLFLLAGFVVGQGGLGWIGVKPNAPVLKELADLALVAVLFTDGMKTAWPELRSSWRLPGRALLLGLPLALAITAWLGHFVAGLPWVEGWLVAAVLSPTDPVFAAAIVGRAGVLRSLRRLLNIESGLNDGLALPIVLGILAWSGAGGESGLKSVQALVSGVAVGFAIAWLAVRIERSRWFAIAHSHEAFLPFAVGLITYASARLTAANEFLAAFTGGITLISGRPNGTPGYHAFSESVAELLKLAALLVFGSLVSREFFFTVGLRGYLFAALVLLAARPIALLVALAGSELPRRERLAAMWFGPKGFASVIYGLMVYHSGMAGAAESFRLVALVVIGSIIAHSSTDVLVARWLQPDKPGAPRDEPVRAG
jgi:NhaP-type Na+/H+ or K+/H+ antiporter